VDNRAHGRRIAVHRAGGTGNEENGMKTIHIPAQDTLTDWFDGYVAAVEAEAGAEHIGDDSQYGCFRDRDGGVWQAYVEPSRSDHDTWCVTFESAE